MENKSENSPDDRLVFAQEDEIQKVPDPEAGADGWKLLIVDDEEDIHKITRITLRGYEFENKGLNILSAYSDKQARDIMKNEMDVALIFLDVVMEREDSGLRLVEYIRKELNNTTVRIVLRTGQPGMAPEQDVITRYDINDYKTKPELTAQKLFTSVTACLRAYLNLKTIEKNNRGLEQIIQSTLNVFANQSFSTFGSNVLVQLQRILKPDFHPDMDSAYLMKMPDSSMITMAGTGRYKDHSGGLLERVMPKHVISYYQRVEQTGGENYTGSEYTGVFRTKEGFVSLLYLSGFKELSEVQQNLVRIYANTIAIGFDNISLTREIINTQKEVILTLGEIVETRSQETANHVVRVAEICFLLAKLYGMDDEQCEMLRLATPMHDVGKIGVPEAILNKPGKLTKDEFKIIQQHSQTGYEILKKSNRSIMKTAAIVARQHHEKWDGTGYPQGLSGEDIHIYGRIAAIADVFDALTHERCYKKAWSIERVVELFKSESGNHFDPNLTGLFLKHIKAFEQINKRFPG